jgi:predicted permease
MLDVLIEVIAPVLAVALVAGFVARRLGIPVANLSDLSFNLFSPALVFSSMSTIDIAGTDTARIAIVGVSVPVLLTITSFAISQAAGHSRSVRASVALTASIENKGNLGLPVAALAFGPAGFEVAIIAFVVSAVVTNSLGVVVASSARGSTAGALGRLFTVPALWAALAGLMVNVQGIDLPTVIEEGASTLAGAAVPIMLVVLGMQLRFDGGRDGAPELAQSISLRLLAGPALTWLVAAALGLEGLTRDTLVVLGGMPSAVFATILATQYGANSTMVTRAVVLGTLCSVGTLTVLIAQYR